MKAILLAAGLGTRLKPLTDTIPKCLIPVRGEPMLAWWTKLFAEHGIDNVLINTHQIKYQRQIEEFLVHTNDKICWEILHEKELLGSAGTLRVCRSFVKGEKDFLIIYADVLTDINITKLVVRHRENKSVFTMAVSKVSDLTGKGIAEIEYGSDLIISFEEKPIVPKSDFANMGVYVCAPEILDLIPDKKYADVAIDLFPQLIGKMMAYVSNAYFCDMGTFEGLEYAEKTWNQ